MSMVIAVKNALADILLDRGMAHGCPDTEKPPIKC